MQPSFEVGDYHIFLQILISSFVYINCKTVLKTSEKYLSDLNLTHTTGNYNKSPVSTNLNLKRVSAPIREHTPLTAAIQLSRHFISIVRTLCCRQRWPLSSCFSRKSLYFVAYKFPSSGLLCSSAFLINQRVLL